MPAHNDAHTVAALRADREGLSAAGEALDGGLVWGSPRAYTQAEVDGAVEHIVAHTATAELPLLKRTNSVREACREERESTPGINNVLREASALL